MKIYSYYNIYFELSFSFEFIILKLLNGGEKSN